MNDILWTPTKERADASTMAEFERFLKDQRGLTFDDYNAMWEWSVTDLDGFWSAIWDYFEYRPARPTRPLWRSVRCPVPNGAPARC